MPRGQASCKVITAGFLAGFAAIALIVTIIAAMDKSSVYMSEKTVICLSFPVKEDCLYNCGCSWCDRGNNTGSCYSNSKANACSGTLVDNHHPHCQEEYKELDKVIQQTGWICFGFLAALVIYGLCLRTVRTTCVNASTQVRPDNMKTSDTGIELTNV